MKKISIIIPAYNEEETVDYLYERLIHTISELTNYEFEVLFVNDGSNDNTLDKLKEFRNKDKRISYIDLSRNFGKEIAMISGLDYVTGDAVVFLDADLQDPPELIGEMIEWWEKGYDDVYARRKSRAGETFLRKSVAFIYYKILSILSSVPIQENTGDFRLLDKRCVEALKKMRECQRYTKGMFSWIGYNKKEILFDRDPRIAGKTKWNYIKLFDLAVEGITSFTTKPLRISSYVGVIVSLISFIYMLFIIINTMFFNQTIPGYPSLMCVILFISGIQLISLGIMGEYIGRIFNETKNRPLYFIKEYNEEKIS